MDLKYAKEHSDGSQQCVCYEIDNDIAWTEMNKTSANISSLQS